MYMATPGVVFILGLLPKLLLPPCIAHISVLILTQFLEVQVPTWIYALSLVLSFPVAVWAHVTWTNIVEEREIKAFGAVRVPVIHGKWPFSLDLLIGRLRHGKDGYPFDNLEGLTRKYGKIFSTKVMGEDRIVSSDPQHIKAMMATDFSTWEKGERFRRQMGSVWGSGVLNADGELWKFHRSMTRPFFSRDRISDFEIFGRHADETIDAIRTRRGDALDFQDLIFRFTLDSATEFLLGSCFGALRGDSDKANRFGTALFQLQHHLAQRSRSAPLWPLFEIFEDKTSANMNIVHEYIKPIIGEALKRKKESLPADGEFKPTDDTSRRTLLDHLVDLTDDPKIIMDETLTLLFAGRDTTASTITFLTYFLALHPDVLHRTRVEVLRQVGETRYPTFDDLRDMKYLRAVINETLRLFPPVPGNARKVERRSPNKGTTLPSSVPGGKPFYIPAHSKVPFAIMHMHRSKDLWGPDAEAFDPDRFLDDRLHKYILPNPFIFLPFNAGPRICLGQQFAYNEISFFIIRLLQAFDHVELAPDAQSPESLPPAEWAKGPGRKALEKIRPRSDLTMYAQGGLWLRLKEASEHERDV